MTSSSPTTSDRLPAQKPPRSPMRKMLPRLIELTVVLMLSVGVFTVVHATSATSPVRNASRNPGSSASTTHDALAPDFTLMTLGGRTFHLASQKGHVVVLFLMATGCAGCGSGTQDLAQALPSSKIPGAEALAIDLNSGDRPADLHAFIQSTGIPTSAPIHWAIDTTGAIATAYSVQVLETTIVIDPQGQIAYRNDGAVPPKQLAQIVRKLA